ncbi:hypothetical protein HRW14_02145 [Streptomyces lunaelactis]|uniref:hypothetical protein n=1 Tax=Streptomyces lunaelactis TaxID=1535768 RepID=UPI0015852869|nr:hypothetical protein [Streptomyces lunaelactis]NUK49115.1 hypothetical protein [Streptomyces lunaelactis]NUK63291.1 hypothetical protein [Streptomyces lunaelactis]
MSLADDATARLVPLLDAATEQRQDGERYFTGTALLRGVPMAGTRAVMRTV